MATAYFNILEYRVLIRENWTELYVLCSPDTDGGGLVGGWYKKVIDPTQPAMNYLMGALAKTEYLSWDKGAPPKNYYRPEDLEGQPNSILRMGVEGDADTSA